MNRYKPHIIIVVCLLIVVLISVLTVNLLSISKKNFQLTTDNLTAQIVALQAERDNLVIADQSIRDYFTSVNATANSAYSLASDINTKSEALSTQIASVINQYNDLSNQVNSWSSRITAVERDLNTLSTKVDNKIDLASLQAVQAGLIDANKLITSLQTQLTALSRVVVSLQAGYYGNTRLLGSSDADAKGTVSKDYFTLSRFPCTQSGLLSVIRLKCLASGSVMVALYSDNGRLITASSSIAVVAGLNSIGVSPVQVTSGTYYWLGFNSSIDLVGYSDWVSGTCKYLSSPYNGFAFPSVLGAGYTASLANILISGWIN